MGAGVVIGSLWWLVLGQLSEPGWAKAAFPRVPKPFGYDPAPQAPIGLRADIYTMIELRLCYGKSMRFSSAGVGVLLLLAGCDTWRGVAIRTSLSEPVDVGCVTATLSTIPEAGEVAYEQSVSRSTELLPKQRKLVTTMHVWRYGKGGRANLRIIEDVRGRKFENSRLQLGRAVPREEVARLIPLMREVNRAIQTQCGVPVADLEAKAVNQPLP